MYGLTCAHALLANSIAININRIILYLILLRLKRIMKHLKVATHCNLVIILHFFIFLIHLHQSLFNGFLDLVNFKIHTLNLIFIVFLLDNDFVEKL